MSNDRVQIFKRLVHVHCTREGPVMSFLFFVFGLFLFVLRKEKIESFIFYLFGLFIFLSK